MSFNGNLYSVDAGEDLTTKGDLHGYDTQNNRIPVGKLANKYWSSESKYRSNCCYQTVFVTQYDKIIICNKRCVL